MTPSNAPLHKRASVDGVHYDYTVSWMRGCITTQPSPFILNPLNLSAETVGCSTLLHWIYAYCMSSPCIDERIAYALRLQWQHRYRFDGGLG
ncbi:hypothetical protein DOTSEDRAFT_43861 [Dothistroma septosporum NZE10]|uniref:Uncharacterized protein n=1 Tax=Dothistroma septosporum (strain NZE10 / CBS 128990) TaxID=675120 RepID=N1PQ80_DOTSN|nr:hypothetical protein DOTSEDRAFT_43861 [Dothistroma septosporum NZE10]